jgi:hypothetical protein
VRVGRFGIVAVAALVGLTVALPTLATGTTPPPPSPSLTVTPTSGPVGTLVSVHSNCLGTVVFEALGGGPATDVSISQPFVGKLLIPTYVGTAQSSPVRPGRYVFAQSCTPNPDSGAFVNIAAPFTVTSSPATAGRFVGMAATSDGGGYWLAQANGGVYSYGDAVFHGSLPGLGVSPAAPIVSITSTRDGGGYWLVAADGGVFAFGDADFAGSLPGLGISPTAPVIGLEPTSDGRGYWLVAADSLLARGEFALGDAAYCPPPSVAEPMPVFPPGFVHGDDPAVAAAANPFSVGKAGFIVVGRDGDGLALPADGGTCPMESTFDVGLPGPPPNEMTGVATSANQGLWLVGVDGGVFAPVGGLLGPNAPLFGVDTTAPFFGSLPGLGITPAAPIVGIAATPNSQGYWLLGSDGGVFAFGNARYFGSANTSVDVYGDCTSPSYQPTQIVLACADYGLLVQDLRWTSWTATTATAVGTFTYNDCNPDCAAGHFHNIVGDHITLTGPVRGAGGQLVFSQMQVSSLPAGFPPGPLQLPTQAV